VVPLSELHGKLMEFAKKNGVIVDARYCVMGKQ